MIETPPPPPHRIISIVVICLAIISRNWTMYFIGLYIIYNVLGMFLECFVGVLILTNQICDCRWFVMIP